MGDQKAFQKDPKWNQKRTKIEHKIQHKIRRLTGASLIRLGPVLSRLGVDLGVKNGEHSLVFAGFRENHVFEEDKAWKCILDGTWVDFGAKKDARLVPDRSQNGANMVSTNDQ